MTAERMGAHILNLPTSHVAMLAMPEAVAAFIVKAAAGSLAVAA